MNKSVFQKKKILLVNNITQENTIFCFPERDRETDRWFRIRDMRVRER